MARKGEEVAVERLHVDAPVGCALCGIDEDGHAVGMGHGDDVTDGVDGAEHVADGRDADQARCRREEADEGFDVEAAVVGDGAYLNLYARAHLQQLPGDDVGVVLHLGDDDLVALCMKA